MAKTLLCIQEFAEAVGVSTYTVRRLMESGEIRNVNVGARRLIPATELDRVSSEGVGTRRKRSSQTLRSESGGVEPVSSLATTPKSRGNTAK